MTDFNTNTAKKTKRKALSTIKSTNKSGDICLKAERMMVKLEFCLEC